MAGRGKDNKDRQLRYHSFLAFLRRFERGISPEDLYASSLRHYDLILEILEGKEPLKEILCGTSHSPEQVRIQCQRIVDFMIFNQRRDPFLSLGLRREETTKGLLNRRWKRLSLLFHPDLYPNSKEAEERAKRINAAYAEAEEALQSPPEIPPVDFEEVVKASKRLRIKKNPPFRRVSSLVVGILIIFLFLSVGLFIAHRWTRPYRPQTAPVERKKESPSYKGHFNFYKTFIKSEKRRSRPKEPSQRSLSVVEHTKSDRMPLLSSEIELTEQYLSAVLKEEPYIEPEQAETVEKPMEIEQEVTVVPETEVKKTGEVSTPVTEKEGQDNFEDMPEGPTGETQIEEVLTFIGRYRDYYEKGRLEAFLSLFDKDAVENGRPVRSLVSSYQQIFMRSLNSYTLSNLSVERESPDMFKVRANYHIKRLVKDTGKQYEYMGWVAWRLKKTEQGFKILELRYE